MTRGHTVVARARPLGPQYDVVVPIHPGFAGSSGFEEMDRMEDLVFHYLDLIESARARTAYPDGSLPRGLARDRIRHPLCGHATGADLGRCYGPAGTGAPTTDFFQLELRSCGPHCSQIPPHLWRMSCCRHATLRVDRGHAQGSASFGQVCLAISG